MSIIMHLVKLLVRYLKGSMMRRQCLIREEFGQPVVFAGKTGSFVEIPFHLEDVFAEFRNIIRRHFRTNKGTDQIDQGLKSFWLVQNRKGDEQAHARGVNGGCCDL